MTEHTPKPNATETIHSLLKTHPDATAAELAAHGSIGRSTATKALNNLAQAGRVRRTPGEGKPGRRAPDRWNLTESDVKPLPQAKSEPAAATSEPDAERNDATTASTTKRPTRTQPQSERLGKGALAAVVLEHLRENSHNEYSPSGVASALNRSSGAVANALERLTHAGSALKTSDKPRRYQYALKRH